MGYSIRNARWRYTEWARWDGAKLAPIWRNASEMPGPHDELYDHTGDAGFGTATFDDFENVNVVRDKANTAVVQKLSKQLRAFVNANH